MYRRWKTYYSREPSDCSISMEPYTKPQYSAIIQAGGTLLFLQIDIFGYYPLDCTQNTVILI